MAEFKSWLSFRNFQGAIARRTRYVRDAETEDFLETVRQTGEKRVRLLPTEKTLWRAQLGKDTCLDNGRQVSCPFSKDRMKPRPNCSAEGRTNPKGIPSLYLATDQATAIAEVRPWVESDVSVGLFKTCKELKLVDCTGDRSIQRVVGWGGARLPSNGEPSAEEREKAVWACINDAFARPITLGDSTADYAPTQIIAELFKMHGYDGIAYHSSVSTSGHNIALFDLEAARLIQCHLSFVMGVTFQFSEMGNPVLYE